MFDASLRITVLGSATPFARPGNACSGYLVEGGGVRVWVDAGSGTLAELQRYVALGDVDAVWISHLHADHSADLLTFSYALLYSGLEPSLPVPLFGPVGIADRLAGFLTNGSERSPVERAFAVEELHDGHVVRIGGLTLTSRAVEHGLPAFALRVEGEDGRSLVYSGDCEPCPSLVELARDCDLFVCEADGDVPGHHSAAQAGRSAAEAGAGRLVVTHVGAAVTAGEAVALAAAAYEGDVVHADPGLRFDVTRRSRTPGRTTTSPASSR
ncbi:MBL fold metallo-hydrolase [Streptomyces sp. NBC_00572]|uniref:MBL fold metallo-hydrolase n=1 Tax=Streptomyces sp. NBC_00572 TaxID=2903664 RepID=UPI0022516EE6|nr:MBL fold metallo-hydrolase [Streptomyces sp. NBC_00572]MCX4980652.1 MBL fold metallo-hydrolase [Streptomyces sp. NBC_00572]